MHSRRGLSALLVAGLLLLAACNGGADTATQGSEPGDATEEGTDAAAATDAASEPSEAAGEPIGDPVDPEAAALAEAAVFRLEDMDGHFKRYAKAEGLTPYTKSKCDPDAEAKALAHYAGVLAKHKTEDAYVGSGAIVFANAADAKAYVDARNGSRWMKCREKEFTAGQKASGGKHWSVKIGEKGSGRGTLDDAYTQFVVLYKGEPTGAHILRYVFREGRVVINGALEQSGNGKDDDLTQQAHDAFDSALLAALERIKESD